MIPSDMKPIAKADRRVANMRCDAYKPLIDKDGRHDGDVLQVNPDRPLGAGFHLYWMPPGHTTTPHRHGGAEEFMVIEGDLEDNDGYQYGPGDIIWLKEGTEHCSTTRDGCLLVVYFREAPDD